MNVKVVIGFLLLFPLVTNAQPPEPSKGSTLTVYSDNHEKFVLVLDGKEQNAVAKDDIKLTGLDRPVYDGKIIFEDKTLPIITADMRVTTPSGTRADAYYNIRRTLDGTIELHFLSVVPINEKYLSNDVKYFAHKGGYGGQFIDYTAPIATKTTTHSTVVNGQTVVVSSSNTGFDLSGQPIKDKDVKFIDYSAPQAKESTTSTTSVNSKGEIITTKSKKVTANDVYGDNNTVNRKESVLVVPSGSLSETNQELADNSAVLAVSKEGNREVVKENVHADYINIQNSSVTEAQLQNLSKVRADGTYVVPVASTDAIVTTAPTTTTTRSTTVVTRPLSTSTTTTRTITETPQTAVIVPSASTTAVTAPPTVAVQAPPVSTTIVVTAPAVTTPVIPAQTVTTTTTDVKPEEHHTSDANAFAAAVKGSVANNAAGSTQTTGDDVPDSKHGKTIKKMFKSMSSYDDNEKPAAAPPVSNIDTTVENGKLVVMVPATASSPNATTTGSYTAATPVTLPDATATTTTTATMPATMQETRTTTTNNTIITAPAATQAITTTTTTGSYTATTPATTPGVVIMDGNSTPYVNSANYEGYNSDGTRRINNAPCPNPMDVPSFDEAKADISALPDDGTKLSTAIMLENSYCFTSQQVFELCMQFTAEHTRLEFAKTSYSKTVDPSNYFKVNNAFQEDASVKELKDFLDKTK